MTDKQHLQRSTSTSKPKPDSPSNPPLTSEGERESGVRRPTWRYSIDGWVWCAKCQKEWPVIQSDLPILGDAFIRLLKANQKCRYCGSGKMFWGRLPREESSVQSRETPGDDATAAQACQSDSGGQACEKS